MISVLYLHKYITMLRKMFILDEFLNDHYRFGIMNEKKELLLQGNELYDIYHYRLKDDDIPTLCTFLATCEVWSLNLCYNRIADEGLFTLIKYLNESSHELISLNLMCNDISSKGIQTLCDMGSDLKIKTLRLNGNKFGAEGGKALSTLLLSNEFLQNLDIGETDQTIESIVYIAAVLRSPYVKLKSLNLSRPLINFSEAHAAEILGQMLFMNSSLTELILEKFGFIDHDIELLAFGLHKFMKERFVLPAPDPPAMKYKEAKSCSSYETVVSVERYMKERGLWKKDEHHKNVDGETESLLGSAEEGFVDGEKGTGDSADNESVECGCNDPGEMLDITNNGESDFNPLNRLIVNGSLVSYLKHLDLSCNHLTDLSIGHLGPYFLSKPPLVILSLAFNFISDVGAVELSRYLPSTIIEVLDISHNNIDFEGIQNLIYRLIHPNRMRKLYLWGNRLNDDVCKYLKEIIEKGNILQENIDLKIYQVDGVDFAAYNYEYEDLRNKYYCVRKIPLSVYSNLSPCMQRLQEEMAQSVVGREQLANKMLES